MTKMSPAARGWFELAMLLTVWWIWGFQIAGAAFLAMWTLNVALKAAQRGPS